MIKISKKNILYLIALFFNLLPSYSVSVFVSSVFIQPRYFWLPFIFFKNRHEFRFNYFIAIGCSLLLISILVPIIGWFFGRKFSLLDLGMVINWIYLIFFCAATLKNVNLFNNFIKIFLVLNLVYILLQLAFYYFDLAEYSMIHSNVPFHVESGYQITSGIFEWWPRYTGLFVESGPLTLFLCFTFLYIFQNRDFYSNKIIYLIMLAIIFSQSKFLILFLPFLTFEIILIKLSFRVYENLISPIGILLISTCICFGIYLIFYLTDLNSFLSENLIAYDLRLAGVQGSLDDLNKLKFFGTMLQGTNFEAGDGSVELIGLDIFSVLFLGYGVFFGFLMILLIISVAVYSNMKFKLTAIAILVLAFLSTGSLLVPHYTFFIIYCCLIHHRENSIRVP